MRRHNLLSGIFWCLILMISCTSGGFESPEVHFVSPTLNASHDLDQDLNIEIDISDDEMIMEYSFWIESDSGFSYFRDQRNINKSHYKLMYTIDLSGSVSEDFSICMEVRDNDGNKTKETLWIKAH